VLLCPSELSRDILFLVLEAAAPGIAKSPSKPGFARGVLERWESVDFLSEVVLRTGVCTGVPGAFTGENEKAFESVYTRGDSSEAIRGADVWSNILAKSTPRVDAP
jgi:hypothetical protein